MFDVYPRTRQGTCTLRSFCTARIDALYAALWIRPLRSCATKLPNLLKMTTSPWFITSRAATNASCTPTARMFMFTWVPISVTMCNLLPPWSYTPSAVTYLNHLLVTRIRTSHRPVQGMPTLRCWSPGSTQSFPTVLFDVDVILFSSFRDRKAPRILLLLSVELAVAGSIVEARSSSPLSPLSWHSCPFPCSCLALLCFYLNLCFCPCRWHLLLLSSSPSAYGATFRSWGSNRTPRTSL